MQPENYNSKNLNLTPPLIEGFLDTFELALTYKDDFIEIAKLFYQHRAELIHELKQHKSAHYSDYRFKHRSWHEKKVYKFIHEYYLNISNALSHIVNSNTQLNPQARFLFDFIINAISPGNFPFLNPETKNLKEGFHAFINDIEKWSGYTLITKCQRNAFKLGETLAATPGKVIFQNHLMQLIQYQATTEKVQRAPILLVTSWVNKYYILDLRKEHSFIRWLISQGYTVFVISWINPTKQLRHKNFSDYVEDGVIQSIKIVRERTHNEKINLFGFCLGGTLASKAIAILAKENLDWILTVTFVATLIDFSKAGPIKQFMGESQIQLFERFMRQHGFMHGYKTLVAFQLIAANENIWPFWIRHYLQGKKTVSLDTLFWSLDITHSTEALYRFYMRKLLQENLLVHSKDYKSISIPIFYVAFKDDWLSPAEGCFDSCQLLSHCNDKTFLLAPGGHLSGMTTKPTEHCQQTIQIKPIILEENFSQWKEASETSTSSWHICWQQWLMKFNHDWITSRTIHSFIEEAPGSFVQDYVWK